MNANPVRLECRGTTAVITMDGAAARNAFTQPMKEGLAAAIAQVRQDAAVRAVVLTGADGYFCAGGDLKGMQSAGDAPPADWRARMHDTQRWIEDLITLDKPLIAAVDGAAYGAGFSMALAADFVLVTPRARFCMVFLRIGLVPDCGAFYLLPRVVGPHRARELMLSAREVGADEAMQLGIATETHEPGKLLPRALELAATFEHASPLAVSLIKRATADAGTLRTVLDQEANAQALAFTTAQHKEAVRRFMDKQPPRFAWPK
jgi:2-(1,2-epoxy-1,2-dihydrophenyl)acetyl-CoA isomerase